jgi:hypothetical protein
VGCSVRDGRPGGCHLITATRMRRYLACFRSAPQTMGTAGPWLSIEDGVPSPVAVTAL